MKKNTILLLLLLAQFVRLYALDPVVITKGEVVRGATLAFVFGSVNTSGHNVIEKGICWDLVPNPDIEAHRVQATALSFRCRLDHLPPASRIYIRAYAKTADQRVFYGENITFSTIPKGKITYTVNQTEPEDLAHYNRIKAAAETAVEYYNNLTSISNKHLYFNYSSGVPTADANYSGWIRFGPTASYQRTGTALHEMAHTIGVGTHTNWSGLLLKNGLYQGRRANKVLQLMTDDPSAYIKGDGTHFWPYGINGAHEDDSNDMTYTINTLIVQAMGEDGLPPSGGFATPAETFAAEIGKKYYIKNEAIAQGRNAMFLVAEGTGLRLKSLSPEEALVDDHAAWYFNFDPSTQYYFVSNVATGKYIGLNSNQALNGFALKDSTASTKASIGLQLMRNRKDILSGDDRVWMNLSGFWMINPLGGTSTQCLQAKALSIYSTAANLSDAEANSAMRWIILDQEETAQFDQVIGANTGFDPDTALIYTIRPAAAANKRIKAYLTNVVHQVDWREEDQGQKWKLQLVESEDQEAPKRYYLYNLGTKKCLTIQKWLGSASSTALALKNTRMLSKDTTDINQQLSLKSIEVDFSGSAPVRHITIENDHPVQLDTLLDERAFRLETMTQTTQIGNFFDLGAIKDEQRWILIPDQVQTTDLSQSFVPEINFYYSDGCLHYSLQESSQLEVFTLAGHLLSKTMAEAGSGSLELQKGIYLLRVGRQQNTKVYKIVIP